MIIIRFLTLLILAAPRCIRAARRSLKSPSRFCADALPTAKRSRWLILIGMLLGLTSVAHANIPSSERAVLTSLYNATKGSSWIDNGNWNGAVGTECDWDGIVCDDGNTHVVEVDVSANNLVGVLPSLSGLTYLQNFYAYDNQLTGAIPALSGLTSLRDFEVSGNGLTGSLPSLSGLTSLQTFITYDNQLTGAIPALSGLSSLVDFEISGNGLTGSIPSLSGLTTLQTFITYDNKLTGSIPALTGLTSLQNFDVSGNQLTGTIPSLTGLTSLQNLDISDNQLTGSIPSLNGLMNLRSVIVVLNQMSGPVPNAPASLTPGSSNLCANLFLTSGSSTIDANWAKASGANWLACQQFSSTSPNPATLTVQPALFVNASTSTNKTSVVRVINPTGNAGTLTATAYDENGTQLGSTGANLGSILANQSLSFTSAQLETAIGFVPSGPTAKYSVNFSADLSNFQIINYTKDNATGNLSLSQSVASDRSTGASAPSVTRTAWFMSASTSTNKTNVLRIINTSSQSATLRATAFDEAGNVLVTADQYVGDIGPHQMKSFTSAQMESTLGFIPLNPTSKYRVVFVANIPSMELINFTKDIATGNLTLVQAQLDDRPDLAGISSIRNVLIIFPSTNTSRTSVIRIVNPTSASGNFSATVYDQSGTALASGSLGTIGPRQILARTSVQLETILGYKISSTTKYRLVVNADLPTFEIINDIKVPSTGNLYLAQPQTDSQPLSAASATSRNVLIVYPSSNFFSTTQLQIINTTGQSAPLMVTAYDDSGSVIASGISLGMLGAYQTLTFNSAQLESAIGYTPPAGSKSRLVITASLSNFEVINYARDVITGNLTLAQQQVN